MSCDRCEDIHQAQREGKQSDECKCSCHTSNTAPWNWEIQPLTVPFNIPWTGDPISPQGETICRDLFWRVNTGLNTGDIQ